MSLQKALLIFCSYLLHYYHKRHLFTNYNLCINYNYEMHVIYVYPFNNNTNITYQICFIYNFKIILLRSYLIYNLMLNKHKKKMTGDVHIKKK